MDKVIGFVAYASRPNAVAVCIREAIDLANSTGGCHFDGWEENDIAGRPLTAPIFDGMERSNILVADITTLNFNVTFEIGYAIGAGRRLFLVRNGEYSADNEKISRIGIFDTLGYETYETAKGLARLISTVRDLKPINTTTQPNRTTPAYILETPGQGQVMTAIKSRIKKARLFFRSFTPGEDLRLSASEAIGHVAASYGVIVPLLSPSMRDYDVHNIRAAFVSGLSLGMEIPTLILQDQDGPLAPLDVRDFVKRYAHPDDIQSHIHDFSLDVFEKLQEATSASLPFGNMLAGMSIGDPMAENEFQTLGNYYLQTDEFNRALRGEINLVVGRKGTGKTALFAQLRDRKRSDKKNVVVDLKPEGYQLIKLKEQVLDYLSAGAKHHLVTAFWEYLLYSEICYKVLEKDVDRHLRDHNLYDGYLSLKALYNVGPFATEGDFSERLLGLSDSIWGRAGIRAILIRKPPYVTRPQPVFPAARCVESTSASRRPPSKAPKSAMRRAPARFRRPLKQRSAHR